MVEAVCGMLLYCWVSYMDPYLGSSGPIQAATTEQCDGGTKLSQFLKFYFIDDLPLLPLLSTSDYQTCNMDATNSILINCYSVLICCGGTMEQES